ncbi:MAG: immunoglobulin domain-containing protein [Verrucomicrobia bacterium]|nr:immunoglobulin domain-containing protein [Verrucomicrobiota bacterium]MDA1068500.1 immunoglobulin domain-containing protein [Verrucomicrobiota bacterium]
MKLKIFLHKLSWPIIFLTLLLQRSPVVRYLADIHVSLTPRVQHIWTVVVGAVTVGAYNTVTGATGDLRFRAQQDDTTVFLGEQLLLVIEVEGGLKPKTWVVPGPSALPEGVSATFNVNFGIATISGTPTEAGSFPVTIQAWQNPNMRGDQAPDFNFTITVEALINQQPSAQVLDLGGSTELTVGVNDTQGVSFQWQKQNAENAELFDDLTGQTGSVLSLANVTISDSGNYRVVVTRGTIIEVSDLASVTVNSLISQQPEEQSVDWNGSAEFTVLMKDPEGVSYQWQKQNMENTELYDDLPSQTSATLSLSNVLLKDSGNYQVVATKGSVVEVSTPALLTVNTTPLQAWLDTHFEDPFGDDTALDQDPDEDMLINAVEFTFGLDPNAMQKEALVQTTQEEIDGVVHAVYSFPPIPDGVDSMVSLEGNVKPSPTEGWSTLVNGVDGVVIENTSEGYIVKVPASVRGFNRLRIISN